MMRKLTIAAALLMAFAASAVAQSVGDNASLTVGTSSTSVALPVKPSGSVIVAPAPGTGVEVFYALGNSGVVATLSSKSLPAGGICISNVGPATTLAAITAIGSAQIRITEITGGCPTFSSGGSGAGALALAGGNPSVDSMLGDSRAAQLTTAAFNALTASQWWNVGNALMGKPFVLGTPAGSSGCRSDQFLGPVPLNAVRADDSGTVFINSPAANDFAALVGNGVISTLGASCSNTGGSFPYVNNNGVTVTATNVGAVVAQNVINAAEALLAVGKSVVLVEEPGQTTLNATGIGQMYDLNFRLRAYANARPGRVRLWSYNSIVWNPTASATTIAFKPGYSVDGTHFTSLAMAAVGAAYKAWRSNPAGAADLAIANVNFVNSTTARSLTTNPLYTTLTGGVAGGSCGGGITGSVPLGMSISCGNAGSSVAVTSAPEPNGFGNQITLAITTTAADAGVHINWAPVSTQYALTDFIYGGADISVAAGSSNAACYMQTANVTNAGTSQQFDLLPINGNFQTTAYAYRLQTLPKQPNAGSTVKSFLNPADIVCAFSAAGTATITIARPWGAKAYIYDPATGQFSG